MPESTSNRETYSDSTVMAVQSGSAAVRLREARRFLDQFEPGAEVLLLGASRGSVDDLARLRTEKARLLDCIDSLSPNSRPGWLP
jgi:hypothetical protein